MKKTRILTTIFAALLLSAAASAQQSGEYIAAGVVKLNGKLSFENKLAVIVKAWGAITARDKKPMECGAYFEEEKGPSYLIYIKGIMLEQCRGDVFVHSVDFTKSPDVFITHPGGRWDKNTTLEQVRKAFPKTAKEDTNTGDDDFTIHPGKEADDFWRLEFRKGKLVSVRYLIQC